MFSSLSLTLPLFFIVVEFLTDFGCHFSNTPRTYEDKKTFFRIG